MQKIKVGVIGCGVRAGGIVSNVLNHGAMEIAGICDKLPKKMDEMAAKIAAPVKKFEDYRQLISETGITAIFVVTPQFTHKELAVAALQAGKHVYCEKPMALNVADCQAIVAAAEKAKKVLMVGQQMRYHHHLHKIADLIKAGEIGRPVMAWLKEFRKPFPETMSWVFKKATGGGMLVEKSCHHFDIFTWLLDARPVSVFASGAADVFPKPFGIDADISDNAFVTVDYDNGARAMLHLCMFMGLPHKYYSIGHHMREIGVLGEKGMIRTEGFDLGNNVELRQNDSHHVQLFKLDSSGCVPNMFNQRGNQGIMMDFVECVRTGKKPFASGEIGRNAVAVAVAAEQSREEKRVVPVESQAEL